MARRFQVAKCYGYQNGHMANNFAVWSFLTLFYLSYNTDNTDNTDLMLKYGISSEGSPRAEKSFQACLS